MRGTVTTTWYRTRRAICWLLFALYLTAGILHLYIPAPFLLITPGWVPYPATMIAVTGMLEIAGAIGLIISTTRRIAGIGLALYAVCVFPANINHAVMDLGSADGGLGWWYHVPRLAAQPLLVWAALFATVRQTRV